MVKVSIRDEKANASFDVWISSSESEIRNDRE